MTSQQSSPTTTVSSKISLSEVEKLNYEIYGFSSFSTNYFPENILVDCPTDQSSRWSAITNNPPQYLKLKLKRPAIVKQIKFGKFEKSHVCNIKKFRIFGGLNDENMVLLLEGGLKNDNIPEVFNLRYRTEDGSENLPILYLKIMPLLSWGPTFNFSIWYIELHGQDDPMYTATCMKKYNKLREIEIVKLCLKHFRQQGYENAFKALQLQTKVRLEHPLIGELHTCLVLSGDFEKAELFLAQCVSEGLMDAYLNRQDYKHLWQLQQTQSSVQPGTRGGHQLVIDTKKRLVYLYGGWDGFQDLSDLWVFDIETASWSLLFANSEKFNGPTPRSCHKMIFDPVSENIFMLGRYLDNSIRTTDYIKSDFFLYDTRAHTWLHICDDTSHVGGPQLVYDHQMCIDAEKRTIYVFGGKILTPRSVTASSTTTSEQYSGLFSYHIATNTWTQILVDCHHPSASQADVLSIKSRITHCMVFHNKNRKLYIYGGQRGKEDIDDLLSYDVDTQAICVLNKDSSHTVGSTSGGGVSGGGGASTVQGENTKNEPSPGYTLRATIDCERDEIYVFSSLSKLKDRRDIQHIDPSNSFWVYSLEANKWTRIYTCCPNGSEGALPADKSTNTILEPCPRYAHQLIYDDVAKNHYLFGGNPGKSILPQLRLDDFWILGLEKPKRDEILKHCRFMVRKLHYEEMVRTDPFQAMQYLRNHIAQVIDHTNLEQLNNFHKLASLLFKTEDSAFEQTPINMTPPLGSSPTQVDAACGTPAVVDDFVEFSPAVESDDCSTAMSSDISSEQRKISDLKRARSENNCEQTTRRAFLFNKIVQLMPPNMVQPDGNLSDFVVM